MNQEFVTAHEVKCVMCELLLSIVCYFIITQVAIQQENRIVCSDATRKKVAT